ncbi:hypothetical protein D9M70_487720 [compost metagenome]
MEDAVGTKTHPVDLLVGLEVQVRGTAADGIQQHLVDETHHRGIVGIAADGLFLSLRIAAFDIQSIEIDIGQVFEAPARTLEQLLDGVAELVVLHQDGLGGQPGAELHVGDGLVVGGVGEPDEQLVAAAPERNDAVLAHQFLADQLPGHAFPVEAAQVAEGHAELLGGQLGQRPALHQLVLHQVGHQRQLVALRLQLRLLGAPFIEQLGKDQLAGEAREDDLIVHGCGIE